MSYFDSAGHRQPGTRFDYFSRAVAGCRGLSRAVAGCRGLSRAVAGLSPDSRIISSAIFVLAFFSFWGRGFSQPYTDEACKFELPVDLTIGSSMASTSYASNYFPIQSGIVIRINGHFVIDVPQFTFRNCTVVMGPNADIQVIGSNNLMGDHSNFYSCNYMWQGIRMLSRGQIQLLGCGLQNAIVGVDFTNGRSTGSIDGCRFDKNQIGIQAVGITLNVTITGNTFQCTGIMLPVSGSTPPPLTQISRAGIRLDDAVAGIGGNMAGNTNTFTKQAHGVLAEFASDATIRNAYFTNNQIGVFAQDGSVKLNNAGAPSQFNSNLDFDIFGRSTDFDVFGNTFLESRRAFRSENNLAAEQIQFAGNQIWQRTNSPAGSDVISIDRSVAQSGTSNRVSFNNIYVAAPTVRGVFARGFAGTNDRMVMYGNHVYLASGLSFVQGIELDAQAANRFHVAENTVHSSNNLATASSRWGIYAHDGSGMDHVFTYNKVIGENGIDPGMCALHCENFPNDAFGCNEVDHTLRGIHMMGDCDNTQLIRNSINDHSAHGLVIQSFGANLGTIGVQPYRGNLFNCPVAPTFDEARLERTATSPATVPQMLASQFFVRPTAPAAEMPSPVRPAANWFRNDVDGPQMQDCPHVQPEPNPNPPAASFSAKQVMTIEGTSGQTGAAFWDDERALIRAMLAAPNLAASNAAASEFFNEKWGQSAGLFAQFDHAFDQAAAISNAFQSALTANFNRKEQFRLMLDQHDASLLTAPNSAWFDVRKIILDSLQQVATERNILKNQIMSQRATAFSTLKAQNDELPDGEIHEQSKKAFNEVMLRQLSGEKLNAADSAAMIDIVQSCPDLVGRTWGAARAFLPVEMRAEYAIDQFSVNDFECANERSTAKSTAFSATLLPNPADECAEVVFERPFTGQAVLVNAMGQTAFSVQLFESKKAAFELSGLPTGAYSLTILRIDGTQISQKLIVLH